MTNGIKAPVWADVYAPAAHAEVESSLHAPLLKIPKAQGAILSHLTSAMTTRTTAAAAAAYSDSTVFKRADTQTSHRAAVRVQMNLGVLRQRIVKRRARGRQRTVGAVSGAVMSTVTISHVLVPMRSVPFWTKNDERCEQRPGTRDGGGTCSLKDTACTNLSMPSTHSVFRSSAHREEPRLMSHRTTVPLQPLLHRPELEHVSACM